MLNLLTRNNNNNKKVISWTKSEISPEKTKPFDSSLAELIFNVGNGRVSIKFNNSVLVRQSSSLLHSNFP